MGALHVYVLRAACPTRWSHTAGIASRAAARGIVAALALTSAAMLVSARPSLAQDAGALAPTQATTSATPDTSSGELDIGLRVTGGLDEVGRFQTFRDPRSGPTLSRLRYARDRGTWTFTAAVDNAGYRDQRYRADFERFGRVQASFEWNQIPTWYSGVSQSPFREELPGVFRLDDSIQQSVQGRTATIAAYESVLHAFDTRARRDIAQARLLYSVTPNLDLRLNYTTQARHGEQPWGAPFGFSNANEVPLTIDHRIHDVATAAEWSNARGMIRVGYDGSWFDNGVEALVWDNPLRFTDQTHPQAYSAGDASSQGRMALFPDSSSHTVTAAGSVALPARSRAFGSVSVGSWIQDERLLPFTINTAITPIPLPRETAEGEARVTAMTYRVTSRPTPMLWLSGQVRFYDFDNRTPHFPVETYVRLDGNVASSVTGGSHPFDYTRHFADVDVSFTPFRFVALRAGYGREHDDRSYRFFEETTEHVWRASVDAIGFTWGSVRLQYDRAERTGEGFDEEAFSEIGEQISLRQFDISDRTRNRLSAMAHVTPWDSIGFNVTAAVGDEQRPDAVFGLLDNDLRSLSVGVDVAPGERLGFGASYTFETYGTLQRSRQANPGPQFDDPTRDWETDMSEDVHTWAFSADARINDRATVTGAYDFVAGRAQYLYLLRPDTTLPAPQQLPALKNGYHRANAEFRYALSPRVALGLGYHLDKYSVDEFGRTPDVLSTPLIPAFVNLLYQWRPYDVHSATARVIYGW